MPFAFKSQMGGVDSARVRGVESLVGELVLAREFSRRGLSLDPRSLRLRSGLLDALMRDALYRDVVASRVKVPASAVDSLARARGGPRRGALSNEQRRNAADTLRALAEQDLAREFMASVLGAQRVRVDQDVFLLLSDSLRSVVRRNQAAHVVASGFRVGSDDFDDALERLGDAGSRILVRMDADSMRLADVAEAFRYQLFTVKSLGRQAFAIELNQALRAVMEATLMSREARRRGYAERPDIRRELDMWTVSWQAGAMAERIVGETRVTDDDVVRWLALHDSEAAAELCEVDVEEVLCASPARAERVLAQLRAGASFDSLARVLSRREAWAPGGGRSGWFAVRDHRRLGEAALLTRLDALAGPVRDADGFSVFRTKGRRLRVADDRTREALDAARRSAGEQARADAVDRAIAALAGADDVQIRYAALRRVSVPAFNMYTKRFIGFGGEMIAAPMIVPRFEWVRMRREAEPPRP